MSPGMVKIFIAACVACGVATACLIAGCIWCHIARRRAEAAAAAVPPTADGADADAERGPVGVPPEVLALLKVGGRAGWAPGAWTACAPKARRGLGCLRSLGARAALRTHTAQPAAAERLPCHTLPLSGAHLQDLALQGGGARQAAARRRLQQPPGALHSADAHRSSSRQV